MIKLKNLLNERNIQIKGNYIYLDGNDVAGYDSRGQVWFMIDDLIKAYPSVKPSQIKNFFRNKKKQSSPGVYALQMVKKFQEEYDKPKIQSKFEFKFKKSPDYQYDGEFQIFVNGILVARKKSANVDKGRLTGGSRLSQGTKRGMYLHWNKQGLKKLNPEIIIPKDWNGVNPVTNDQLKRNIEDLLINGSW